MRLLTTIIRSDNTAGDRATGHQRDREGLRVEPGSYNTSAPGLISENPWICGQ